MADAYIELHIGRRKTTVSVRPDSEWSGMWRVHDSDRISDMVNLARAKDAAISWARPRGIGSGEVVHWRTRETAPDPAYSTFGAVGCGVGAAMPAMLESTETEAVA